ncbi:hypothetical protein [Salinimonas iocasae]|uniref:Uncharacterized protein n=1 Tax=Salinimonas iocasae TaxID=2572577 RepID=A0A5B7YDQ7_9ALTE|nr:hypothetical protein [Salinimonas iocasae]QCZ93744.1 hypothetical protein FBQ74_09675 [Salinimonas iocasae]
MEILDITNEELNEVNGGAFGDWEFGCCSVNVGGFDFSFELFSYSGTFDASLTKYSFERSSAYNRL